MIVIKRGEYVALNGALYYGRLNALRGVWQHYFALGW